MEIRIMPTSLEPCSVIDTAYYVMLTFSQNVKQSFLVLIPWMTGHPSPELSLMPAL